MAKKPDVTDSISRPKQFGKSKTKSHLFYFQKHRNSILSFSFVIVGLSFFLYNLNYFLMELVNMPDKKDDISSKFSLTIIYEVFGLMMVLIGFAIRNMTTKLTKYDFIKSMLVSSIAGGFIIYLVILKIQPRPFFAATASPDENWWAAISLIATLVVGLLIIEFVKFNELAKFKGDLEEKVKKLEEFNSIRSLLYEDQVVEGLTHSEKWEQFFSKIRFLENRSIVNSDALRAWSTHAWKEGSYNIAVSLRELAYKIDPNDDWNKIYLAYIYIENPELLSSIQLLQIEKRFESVLKDITPFDHSIQGWFHHILGKLYLRKNELEKARMTFFESLKSSPSFYNYVYFCISYIISGKSHELVDDTNKIKSNFKTTPEFETDNETIGAETFRALVHSFTGPSVEKIESFYASFAPLKSLEFQTISNYSRYSLYDCFKFIKIEYPELDTAGVEINNNYELQNIYLAFYYFFGNADVEANSEINPSKDRLKKIEDNIISVWKLR